MELEYSKQNHNENESPNQTSSCVLLHTHSLIHWQLSMSIIDSKQHELGLLLSSLVVVAELLYILIAVFVMQVHRLKPEHLEVLLILIVLTLFTQKLCSGYSINYFMKILTYLLGGLLLITIKSKYFKHYSKSIRT